MGTSWVPRMWFWVTPNVSKCFLILVHGSLGTTLASSQCCFLAQNGLKWPYFYLKKSRKIAGIIFSPMAPKSFSRQSLPRMHGLWSKESFFNPIFGFSTILRPRNFLAHPVALKWEIPYKPSAAKILGTCRFLGTTMLFFEKFTVRRNFFIYGSLSYDAFLKSYGQLKFLGETRFFQSETKEDFPDWPPHLSERTVVLVRIYKGNIYIHTP